MRPVRMMGAAGRGPSDPAPLTTPQSDRSRDVPPTPHEQDPAANPAQTVSFTTENRAEPSEYAHAPPRNTPLRCRRRCECDAPGRM